MMMMNKHLPYAFYGESTKGQKDRKNVRAPSQKKMAALILHGNECFWIFYFVHSLHFTFCILHSSQKNMAALILHGNECFCIFFFSCFASNSKDFTFYISEISFCIIHPSLFNLWKKYILISYFIINISEFTFWILRKETINAVAMNVKKL